MQDSKTVIEDAQMIFTADSVMSDIARVFKDDLGDREKVGGYLSLIDPFFCETQSSFTIGIGSVDPESAEDYKDYSAEKPYRAKRLSLPNSFVAEYNPPENRCGGGFWITEFVEANFGIGFEGLIENLDAVFCMLLLTRLRILKTLQATKLISQCEVPELSQLWKKAICHNLH